MLHIDVSAVNIPYDLLSKEEIEEINHQVIKLTKESSFHEQRRFRKLKFK